MLLSDDRLSRRASDGDERAFAAIFRRYQESLYRYCLAIVGNPEDAQDALQNTMVKVLRALPGEERRIKLKPWLYRIAHNESIELIRRRRPSEELDLELVAGGVGLAEEAAQRQRLGRLLADLDQLPERQRGALVMRELGGLGFEEIGVALGASAAAARQTLYEARLGLRQMDAGRELSCGEVMRAISDADGRVLRRRDIRAHLRGCESCQSFRAEIEGRRSDLAALSPLPAAVAAGLLQGLLGGGGASGGGGLAATLGGGAAKSLAGSAAVKGAATVAVVAVIGVTAADRGGLIHVAGSGSEGSGSVHTTPPASGEGPAPASVPVPKRPGAAIEPAVAANAERDRVGKGEVVAGATDEGSTAEPAPSARTPGEEESSGTPRLPSASAHGQETAATHKAGKPTAKPAHPAHPAKPAKTPSQSNHSHPAHPVRPTHPQTPSTAQPPPANPAQTGRMAGEPSPAPEITPATGNGKASNSGK